MARLPNRGALSRVKWVKAKLITLPGRTKYI